MSKQDLMRAIVAEVIGCRGCELWRQRRNPVLGEGNVDAAVVFVGEAPGYWEDVKGRPFVGAAGKLLDELLSEIGLSRGDIYIANILKCRPSDNRDPSSDEVAACTPFLNRQIQIIGPRLIVTLGRHATSYILSEAGFPVEGITKLHGRTFTTRLLGLQLVVIPAFHPAAALYNVKYKRGLEDDFQIVKLELEKLEEL
ncbi:uracil-DNA glycosylase [Candidatus Bathyarchaeota archaeon]|nr:MAG: uracil-DNA glycosylase [Candidatus Bathyarchaeota archaeon]